MIKPSFWEDEKLATISRDARLTYIGMWNFSDDYGVVKGHYNWLKNTLYPYECDLTIDLFSTWLKELKSLKRIVPFSVNSERYYFLPKFIEHQTINRPSKHRYPTPPEEISGHSRPTHDLLTDEVKLSKVKLSTIVEIVAYLNLKSGKNFKETTKETKRAIGARWEEGFRIADFKRVIETKCAKWKSDEKMADYLRPQTLFGTKFEAYLNEVPSTQPAQYKTTAEEEEAKWKRIRKSNTTNMRI
jgi:uncharacterized phage protein (TIGR02220 family)